MADWLHPETFDVPRQGGTLKVATWGDREEPVVLAAHGLTASHMEWPYVAKELQGQVRFVALDLRGRGGSRDLPGPWGMKVHADDLIAVLDHIGAEKAVVVGHSMGGFVGAILAMHYPERVSSLVLIDGGIALPIPPDADIEQILVAMTGPAIERCRMTFGSVEEALEFWKQHPALQDEGAWTEVYQAYVAYDLMGEPPELRSKTDIEAVLGDGRDSLQSQDIRVAIEKLSCPIVLLRAPRGILNEPTGLYPHEVASDLVQRIPNFQDELVEDVNHYTIVMTERGAAAVARRIRQVLEQEGS